MRLSIHLCRVDKVDAVLVHHVELLVGLLLGVLLAKGHDAEAKRADAEIGASKLSLLQEYLPSRQMCAMGRSGLLSAA